MPTASGGPSVVGNADSSHSSGLCVVLVSAHAIAEGRMFDFVTHVSGDERTNSGMPMGRDHCYITDKRKRARDIIER